MPVATRPSHLADARTAIAAITPSLVRLVRESAHDGPAVGHWKTSDVACHVCQVIEADTDALAGRPLPIAELTPASVAGLTDAYLAADPERDFGVLADRIETLLAEFLAVSATPVSEEVTWLGGIRIPASAVACHLLEELLVHGFDLASGNNRTWTIAPAHAALAIEGAAIPIVNAAGPTAFVNPKRARDFRARFDARLRGHQRFTLVFDDGFTIREDTSGPVDAHVSADPVAMLLLLLGRIGPMRPMLGGKLAVWGRRPWRLRRMLTAMAPP
jgi:hypothetical protein